MRLVLDTNILARAVCSPGGPAAELFERTCARHVLIVSSELLEELARVLSYDRLRRMHQLSDAEIEAFIEGIENGATVVPLPDPLPRVVPDDPDDDVIVATAVAGRGEVLCTLNRHLFHERVIEYCRGHAISVLNDVDLLRKLRENELSQS
jgi:putative PIN family toxin of toxin-antitoxin system